MLTRCCRQVPQGAASLATAETLPKLTLDSLQILARGVARYPDDLPTIIFQASRHPIRICAAAQGRPSGGPPAPAGPLAARPRQAACAATEADPAVEARKAYPVVLRALDASPAATFRLELAHQNPPDGVWAAVRAEVENRLRAPRPAPGVRASRRATAHRGDRPAVPLLRVRRSLPGARCEVGAARSLAKPTAPTPGGRGRGGAADAPAGRRELEGAAPRRPFALRLLFSPRR